MGLPISSDAQTQICSYRNSIRNQELSLEGHFLEYDYHKRDDFAIAAGKPAKELLCRGQNQA